MPVQPRRCLTLVSAVLIAALLAPIFGAASPAGAAAGTVASSSSGSSVARNSITLSRPAGTAAGHVMVAQIVSNDDDPGFRAPAGWTVVSDRSISALRQVVYIKVAGTTEPPSYTWTLSTSTTRRIAGGLTAYSGIDTATPIDAASTSVNTTASTNVAAPSITTTLPGAMVVHLAAINAEGALSAPAGMAERWEATSPNSGSSRDALASASDAIQAAAGATGVRTATGTSSGANIATLLALRPSGPPPPPPPPDTTAPVTTIDSGPTGTVTTSSATFTFSANEPAVFQCSLDGAAVTGCASPKTYTGLANGSHTFAVRAIDPSNNVGAPDTATWAVDAPLSDPVLVGAGDIAGCGQTNDSATAALLDNIPGTVFTTGDSVYNDGTATQFATCYDPTWGRHKARTKPSAGNHDYQTGNANGYFGYFGAAAGDPAKGYYDYTLGAWHVIVLNSNCSRIGGCGEGSPQLQWLRSALAASSAPCTAAIWHHTRFSSGARKGNDPAYVPFWQALYDHGADVVINGHDHLYERFGLQDPSGNGDPAFGIRQFTVGTGGASHYEFGTTKPNSERRNADTFGVLKLTLHAASYDWQFVPVAGKTFTDSGTATCHGAPTTPPPPPPPPPPTSGPITPVASSSSGSSSSRTSITLTRPAGTAAGHVMVAQIVSNDDNPGFSAPAGWTLVSDRSIPDSLRQTVYVKVAGSSEPGSYTWTMSDWRRIAGGITTYSGVHTTAPIDAAGTSVNTGATAAVTAPSVTTTVADTRLVHLAAIRAEGTLSAPAGMDERWEATSPNSSNSRDALASASDATQAPAGVTGVRTAGATRTGPSIGTLIALRPAGP
jgi:hypothetical protein